jgi:dihydroxyacetone kinase DhaKLM complex PTS-EIIA-like component DhaM
MRISEFIMTKALQLDDFRLTKIAQELYDTEADKEYVLKEAGLLDGGLMAAGKALLANKTTGAIVRNAGVAAVGGAVAGAANADEGNRISGALKGGILGGVVGGAGTYASQVLKRTGTVAAQNLKMTTAAGAAPASTLQNLGAATQQTNLGVKRGLGQAIDAFKAPKVV